MTAARRQLTRNTARIFVALATPPLCAAAAHAVAAHPPALELRLAYPPPSGRAVDALAIFAHNSRVAALVLGATLLAATLPATARGLAVLLIAVAAINLALVSAVILADGSRAEIAILPHGLLELLAYSLAGAGFLHARDHGPASDARLLLKTTAAVAAVLVFAALVEVSPW